MKAKSITIIKAWTTAAKFIESANVGTPTRIEMADGYREEDTPKNKYLTVYFLITFTPNKEAAALLSVSPYGCLMTDVHNNIIASNLG